MLQRTITGAVFVVVLICCIVFGPLSFAGLVFTITLIGLHEFYGLAEKTGHQPQHLMGFSLFILLFFGTIYKLFYFPERSAFLLPLVTMIVSGVFLLFIIELYRKKENPFGNIAFTFLGLGYVAIPFLMFCFIPFQRIRIDHPPAVYCEYIPHRILGIFFILWASDTGAYLSGRAFGKHKLFESISPGKTWEGTIGGGMLSIVTAYFVSLFYMELSRVDWLTISLIIIVMGNFGDLVESLFKRSVAVKDSGTILPGHGGILDRFDSLILSTPFIFIYLLLINKL